jgi:asparagine synthase (glutamine-hydrolysing)
MCGIAGIVSFAGSGIETEVLKTMGNCLRNRGPDDLGFLGWSGESRVQLTRDCQVLQGSWLTLVHRRLSILDLTEAGWQPMLTPDGRYAIVFNGEIYNYLELQSELKALGYQFHSHSDTEVLLYAYAQWGKQALTRLVGMFAFAILDTQERKLFLARDFFGIKPLYYTHLENGFAFASEIKALLTIPGVSRRANSQRLYQYLQSEITDYGNQTLFAEIQQLPSAHYLEIDLDTHKINHPVRYWQINLDQPYNLSYSEATQQLRQLFLENIQLHLRSDVPVGAALSGGIDSSAIVMAMRHLEGKDLQLYTFSYLADDPQLNEEKWVDLVSHTSDAKVYKIQPQPEELIADLEQLIQIQDEPFGSTSIYAQYCVFRQAKATGIKVMLDGQGADEMLGGYRPYLAARLASLIRQGKWGEAKYFLEKTTQLSDTSYRQMLSRAGGLLLPSNFQGIARKFVGKDLIPPWLNATWMKQNQVFREFLEEKQSEEILREQLYQAFGEVSLPRLLRYEDRNSMAHSIESRVPFLTPALVNFIFSLPEEFIIASDGTSKAIFREAMRGIVPNPILNRKDKIGFATPEQKWLTTIRPWVESVLESEIAAQIPALNLKVVQREAQGILDGQKHFDWRLWRWVNLIKWAEYFSVSFE